jgi:hypothetical protein
LPEVTISRENPIFDYQIFKRHLPCIFKYGIGAVGGDGRDEFVISKRADTEEKKGSSIFQLIVPNQVFISLAQYYPCKGQKRVSDLWIKAGEASPNGTAKKLTRNDRKIQKRFFNLAYTGPIPNVRKSSIKRIKHFAFLQNAKCWLLPQ